VRFRNCLERTSWHGGVLAFFSTGKRHAPESEHLGPPPLRKPPPAPLLRTPLTTRTRVAQHEPDNTLSSINTLSTGGRNRQKDNKGYASRPKVLLQRRPIEGPTAAPRTEARAGVCGGCISLPGRISTSSPHSLRSFFVSGILAAFSRHLFLNV
jgi:hypothetical protein